ncbi:MAG: cyclase family protein [Chloroflexi bacterium]|nr:cyclase family protein [Chloroflexota bacterium]
MPIFDITLTISNDLPVWPGDPAVNFYRVADVNNGDVCTLSRLETGSHIGTHLDAPLHFVKGGRTVDQLDLTVLIGPCVVVYVPDATVINAALLDTLDIPADTRRLLFRTRNSEIWARGDNVCHTDYVGIDPSGAAWLVERGVQLVGVDYMSVAPFADTIVPHEILLGAGIIAVENLNLSGIEPGNYQLICLPLKLKGGDGAPVRAILISNE